MLIPPLGRTFSDSDKSRGSLLAGSDMEEVGAEANEREVNDRGCASPPDDMEFEKAKPW